MSCSRSHRTEVTGGLRSGRSARTPPILCVGAVLWCISAASEAHALKCPSSTDIASQLHDSDTVVSGTVTAIRTTGHVSTSSPMHPTLDDVTFNVDRVWKGDATDHTLTFQAEVVNDYWPNPFTVRRSYLVFLKQRDSTLSLPICGTYFEPPFPTIDPTDPQHTDACSVTRGPTARPPCIQVREA